MLTIVSNPKLFKAQEKSKWGLKALTYAPIDQGNHFSFG